jgi:hypothetical protein
MKNLLVSFCFLTVVSLLAPVARAQTNFLLSTFQCDPSSCVEQSPPDVVGSAFVSYNAACTGGAVGSFEGSASSVVGKDGPCNSPFVAKAQVTRSRQTQLDDFGCPYDVDSVTQTAQVLTPLQVIVFSTEGGVSCDGGTFGPTNNGTRPC